MIGGLLGAIFIRANNRINRIRKRILKTHSRKIIEGLILTALTVSAMYLAITFNYWVAGKTAYDADDNLTNLQNPIYNPYCTVIEGPNNVTVLNTR